MPVTEDPPRHVDPVPHGSLHGVAAAVDLRRHALDLDARRRLLCLREQHDLESFDDLESSNRIPCAAVKLPRSSGVFLHPTSLPRGRLDEDAYRLVDWLEAAGQSWWQVLPLGPPDELGSPYRAASAFAASPQLLADPKAPVSTGELDDYVARHPYWIGAWAQFAGPGAVADQFRFEREWTALRGYARARGVRLIGDVPLYVSDSGADVQAWPELFTAGVFVTVCGAKGFFAFVFATRTAAFGYCVLDGLPAKEAGTTAAATTSVVMRIRTRCFMSLILATAPETTLPGVWVWS